PDAGTATISTANGCADVNFTLSATGLTAATGISYQWQASANGTTGWADISGAISTTYVASTSVTKYYRLVTTCSLSSQTNETNVVSYTVTGNACVCESYPESYSNFYTSDEDIGNVTVGTLNNSSTLGELAAGANSEAYVYSNYAGVVAAPDLQQLEEVSFSLSSIISSGSYNKGFQIFIDYNQDGVFSKTERVYSSPSAIAGAHTETGSFIVPITAMPGITRMRVINIEETFPTSTNYTTSTPYDYGETEDYCVNITLAPNCDATPNAGTASINFASGCLSTPHTVTATGLSAATGIQFHWQYSLDGSTGWTDIEDADASSYTNITDVTTYYRLKSTCSFTGLSNFTNVVSYTVTGNDCCVSTLNLYDDATDGWGGDYVTVTVGGTVLGTYTLASGAGPFTIYITSDADEAISIVYTGTNNYSDSYFDLIGPGGNYYAQDWYPTDYSTYYDGPWNGRGCPIPQPGDMCEMSIAFCTGTNYSFPTGVDNPPAPDGPEYGCLSTQPNPVYYYLRIDQPGSMEILIESDCGDVDFAAWGPFDATTCDPLDLTAAGNPGTGGNYDQPYGNLVDCAYSTAAIEYLSIPDAEVGEYYMVMINNFANCDGIISFEQISGEGSSDCSIVAPPVSNNGPYCVGQDIELSVNYPVTGASYNWTGPNGFTSTVMNPTITNADPSDSGTYSLIITVGSEVSEPETTDVTVSNPQPLTTVAAGDFVFRNIGTDWNTASNWLECTGADAYIVSAIVPTALDNVVICAGTTCASSEAIIYTSGATCNNITIESGCVLTVDGAHSLTVHSNWTNNGTFNPSTGTVVFNGTSNVLGSTISHDFYNVTINASKIMTAPATNMNVMGNWTNNGTFNHNTGTVTLLGSSAQNVSSGINSQFYNLTVQNSSTGILLLDDAEVLNILTLNDGVVSTSANKLISRSISTNAIDGFSNQSFINGNLRKFVINATTYACPVGLGLNSTDYHRLDFISNISGGTSYIDIWVEAISESANNIDANISTAFQDADIIEVLGEDAIWHIVPDVVPVGTYGVKLYVENMGLSDLDDNKFFVTKRPESSSDYSDWDTFDDIVSIPANGADGRIFNGGSGYAQANGFNSFSQYSIAKSNTVLPVEMVSFEVKCDNDVAILSWQTASEINNDYFIIEKSNDLRNFNEIARVKGNGNSNSFKSYTVVDDNANIKVSYYRIIQVDFDGTRNVGNVITSDCFSFTNELPLMIAYPNPFNDELKIAIENCYEQQFIIEIFDNASRLVFAEVYKTNDNTRNLNLDLSYLNPGIYTIRFKSNLHTINKKIAKQ
ncbi:MAG: GEVED domain-containing protein, partial [Ignavibacteriaceae bacterium]|nr:GEVED domain-containing protein [Ignavibacteriaceae bacterium]